MKKSQFERILEFEKENTDACRSWATFYKQVSNKLFDVLFAAEKHLNSKHPKDIGTRMNLRNEVFKFNKWWGKK